MVSYGLHRGKPWASWLFHKNEIKPVFGIGRAVKAKTFAVKITRKISQSRRAVVLQPLSEIKRVVAELVGGCVQVVFVAVNSFGGGGDA